MFFEEIWGTTAFPGNGALSRSVKWPGGRGQIIVKGFSSSPGVQIDIQLLVRGAQIASLYTGLAPISANGIYAFEAPEGTMQFDLQVTAPDSAALSLVWLAQVA